MACRDIAKDKMAFPPTRLYHQQRIRDGAREIHPIAYNILSLCIIPTMIGSDDNKDTMGSDPMVRKA